MIHEYGIAAEDMEPDFKAKVFGKSRRIDIAIFKPGTEHLDVNLYRVVVIEKEPKVGIKGAYRMRDSKDAAQEFELMAAVMAAAKLRLRTVDQWSRAFLLQERSNPL